VTFESIGPTSTQWSLPEAESIPIALTLNELLTNAVKHSAHRPESEVSCVVTCGETLVRIAIGNVGALPDGFNIARIPGAVSGLGLVRALLPRRSASITLEQHDDRVVAEIELESPCVVRSGSRSAENEPQNAVMNSTLDAT